MPGARATSDNKNSLLYVLIIFIVLFLVATAFAIVLYLSNEDYIDQASNARDAYDEITTRNQYNAVKPLISKRGDTVQITALGRIMDDMTRMAQLIAGAQMQDEPPVGIRRKIDDIIEPVLQKAPSLISDPCDFDKSQGLANIILALIAERDMFFSQYQQAEEAIESQKGIYDQRVNNLEDSIVKINERLEIASSSAQTTENQYETLQTDSENRYELIINQLNEKVGLAQERENKAHSENRELKAQATDFRAEIKRLKERLRQFQPAPEMEMDAMEPDGHVVSVVPHENLAYINLAQNDHIYRGLTFTVYDRYQSIQRSGKGKATLEVIEIGQTVSKCRIIKHDPTDPIIQGDIIGNLIWNQDKEYLFCVIGEFDFNGDGKHDPQERDQITDLIQKWGGLASENLTVDTDFLIIGSPPMTPAKPDDEYADTEDAAARAYQNALKKAQAYGSIRSEGMALGIPIFNLKRFLYFIGYYQQTTGIM